MNCGASVGLSAAAASILAHPEGGFGGLFTSLLLAYFGGRAARPCLYGQDTRVLSGAGRFCDETVKYTMPWIGVFAGTNYVEEGSTPRMALPVLAAAASSAFLRHRACTAFPGSQP